MRRTPTPIKSPRSRVRYPVLSAADALNRISAPEQTIIKKKKGCHAPPPTTDEKRGLIAQTDGGTMPYSCYTDPRRLQNLSGRKRREICDRSACRHAQPKKMGGTNTPLASGRILRIYTWVRNTNMPTDCEVSCNVFHFAIPHKSLISGNTAIYHVLALRLNPLV